MMDAKRLMEILEEYNFEPRSYSGRYMYGKHCVGVAIDHPNEMLTMGRMFSEAGVSADEFNDLRDDMRSDQLGLGWIIYWPHIAWPEEKS